MSLTGTTTASGTRTQRRREARKPVKHSGILHYNGTQIPVVLQDMSRGGVRIGVNSARSDPVIDGPVVLEVPGAMRLPLQIRWQSSTAIGAAFALPPSRKATCQQQIDRLISRAAR